MIDSIINNTTGHLQVQDALYHDEPSMDHALEYGEEVKEHPCRVCRCYKLYSSQNPGILPWCKRYWYTGVYVMGIVPEKEDRMNDLSSKLIEGEMFTDDDQFAVIASWRCQSS
jgi:hypothetical protein